MCGRYNVDDEENNIEMQAIISEMNRKYNGTRELEEMKTGEIFPSNCAPILSDQGATIMRWGIPTYGSTKSIINARSETVEKKPMFMESIQKRRAVVPTTGFYEWTHEGKKAANKYLFVEPDEDMLYLAAIYSVYLLAVLVYGSISSMCFGHHHLGRHFYGG